MNRAAALDTNVLLLHLVAATDVSLLKTFKRVSTFEASDASLLETTLASFGDIFTTPHVLAEASNLVDQAPPHRRTSLVSALQRFIATSQEHYQRAAVLSVREEFLPLGLSDTGLCDLSNTATVITTDFRLAGKIAKKGGRVLNFEHLRSAELLSDWR